MVIIGVDTARGKRASGNTPGYEVIPRSKPGRFRNRSASPTRIAIGSRRVRTAGSFRPIARTATQSPSSKGSETISKRSPYIFMCLDAVKPRSLTFAQLSEQICIVFSRLLQQCPGLFCQPGYFSIRRQPLQHDRSVFELCQPFSPLLRTPLGRDRSSPFRPIFPFTS